MSTRGARHDADTFFEELHSTRAKHDADAFFEELLAEGAPHRATDLFYESLVGSDESLAEEAPKVSDADLRTRIDAYLDMANAEYDLGGGVKARALPQFRYARGGRSIDFAEKVVDVIGKTYWTAIRGAAFGRPTPKQLATVTQALIDKGELAAVRTANDGLSDSELIRKLQRKFHIGIDCAGYVQLAFIHAFTGSDADDDTVRDTLGLKKAKDGSTGRGNEALQDLRRSAMFDRVDKLDAKVGDLIALSPKQGSTDQSWHTVIVVDHPAPVGDVHTFVVDASWGTDLYTEDFGGVMRRQWKFDKATKKWWDVHPDPAVTDKQHVNDIGPYDRHTIEGVYRVKQK